METKQTPFFTDATICNAVFLPLVYWYTVDFSTSIHSNSISLSQLHCLFLFAQALTHSLSPRVYTKTVDGLQDTKVPKILPDSSCFCKWGNELVYWRGKEDQNEEPFVHKFCLFGWHLPLYLRITVKRNATS